MTQPGLLVVAIGLVAAAAFNFAPQLNLEAPTLQPTQQEKTKQQTLVQKKEIVVPPPIVVKPEKETILQKTAPIQDIIQKTPPAQEKTIYVGVEKIEKGSSSSLPADIKSMALPVVGGVAAIVAFVLTGNDKTEDDSIEAKPKAAQDKPKAQDPPDVKEVVAKAMEEVKAKEEAAMEEAKVKAAAAAHQQKQT